MTELLSLDWWFRDRETGEITVAQFPNPPLWIFIGSILVGWFTEDGTWPADIAHGAGTLGLSWWAIDEIVRGANPWRRLLGVAGLLFVPVRLISLF